MAKKSVGFWVKVGTTVAAIGMAAFLLSQGKLQEAATMIQKALESADSIQTEEQSPREILQAPEPQGHVIDLDCLRA